jgi:predicted Zn finger-like uncharacterized protein
MFLTCPQCETHFSVPDTALFPDGKKVRCSICKHVWFQEPSIEEAVTGEDDENFDLHEEGLEDRLEDQPKSQENNKSFDDIPQSLKQGPDDSEIIFRDRVPAPEKKALFPKELAAVVGLSFALFIIIMLALIALKVPVAKAFPSSYGFYSMIGFTPDITGKDLTFHDIEATVDGKTLRLKAKISNLSTEESALPYILAEQLDKDGNTLTGWIIDPVFKTIIGGGTESFESEYEAMPEMDSLKLSLVVEPVMPKKSAEKDYPQEEAISTTPEQIHAPEDHHNPHGH